MSNYFIKDFEWLVVSGLDGIELYNVNDGSKIIHLKKTEAALFEQILRGKAIEEFEKEDLKDILKVIKDNKIGTFSDKFFINNEYKIGKDEIGYFDQQGALVHVYIEIPSKCELCKNCDKIITAPCYSCHKTKDSDISIEKYCDIIDSIKEYNVRRVILHGANILKEDLTYGIINKLVENNIETHLILHNKMLKSDEKSKILEIVKSVPNNLVKLIVNFDIMSEKVIESLYADIKEVIEYYGEDNIIVSLKIEKSLCSVIKDIKKNIYDLGGLIANVSVVSDEVITEEELEAIYRIDMYDYEGISIIKKYNRCMAGVVALDTELNVMSCPHMRDNIVQYKDGELDKENKLKYLWTLTKDKVEQCKDCSMRYRCMECRAVEVNYTKKVNGKRECKYYIDNI